jgi:Ion transport protein
MDISNLAVLILIFIFTYMLLGLELFAYKESFNEDDILDLENGSYPRINFNTPFESFISVFIVLANEGWSILYQKAYRSTDAWTTSIFFYSLVIVGQFLLMNLFMAVLIENFEELSVRNDLMNKLRHASQKSVWQKIIEGHYFKMCCKKKKKKSAIENDKGMPDEDVNKPGINDDIGNDQYEEMKK